MEPLKVRATFATIMSAMMVTIITFVLGPVRGGFPPEWPMLWAKLWIVAWPTAAVAILFCAPVARRWTQRLLA